MNLCTLCKTPIPDAFSERWSTTDGKAVEVLRSAIPSAVVESSVGEFEICEPCYQRQLPSFFTPGDVAEIHYQFGLEYFERGLFARSIESLTLAGQISETADILAALARAEDALGHQERAVALYCRALEIDPSHFMSRENLKLL